MAFVAHGGLWFSSASNSVSPPRTAGIVQAIASGDLRMTTTGGSLHFDVSGAPDVIAVTPGSVVVATALQAQTLGVADADGSGLAVVTTPAVGVPSFLGSGERSLRWRQSSTAQPAGWDVRDGQSACLRLTRPPTPTSAELAYGILINQNSEMQLYRVDGGSNNANGNGGVLGSGGSNGGMRVVACFGGARGPGASLPVSKNPFLSA